MNTWLQKLFNHSSKFYRNEEGATATEYATLIVLLVFVIAASVYSLADSEGEGVAQKAFDKVGKQAGQFSKVSD